MYSLAKDMSPPNPSLPLLEMVEFGELLWESPSPSDSPGSLRLLGRRGRWALEENQKVSMVCLKHRHKCILCNLGNSNDTPPPTIKDHHHGMDGELGLASTEKTLVWLLSLNGMNHWVWICDL